MSIDTPETNLNTTKGGERMRTDATKFNFGGLQNTSNLGRMDRTQKSLIDDIASGFGKDSASKTRSRFQETYNEVAKSNSSARETTENSTKNCDLRRDASARASERNRINDERRDSEFDSEYGSVQDDYESDQSRSRNAVTYDDNEFEADVDETERSESKTIDEQTARQASETITAALSEIADSLQLNIVSGLENVNLENPTSETVDQFSQIVHDLKTIIGALEASVAQGESIDTGKKVIENAEAGELVVKLNAELFKIEIGVNMLGKSGDVQAKLAQMTDAAFSNGIPQAIDPSQIAVSADQMKKIFGKALSTSEDSSSVSQLVKKINELVKDTGIDSAQVQVVSTTSDSQQSDNGPASYDSMTYRAMLKLEASEQVAGENADAALDTEKTSQLQNAEPLLARDVSAEQVKVDQTISITELTVKAQTQQTAIQEARPVPTLPKALEQSVVNQIADRLSNAVRNGVTEVRVQLRPESLGDVTVKIRIEGDVVTAKMQVESQQVKAIVENNFQSLRDSLQQHNLQIGTLQVDIQSGGQEQGAFEQGFEGERTAEQNNGSSGDSAETAQEEIVGEIGLNETGRRFGNNSVEYFA